MPERYLKNSLTAKSILAGEKLVLFGRFVLNLYIGTVQYILCETKTWHAKIYLPTQRTNWQILAQNRGLAISLSANVSANQVAVRTIK
jgi:hypothetical protein